MREIKFRGKMVEDNEWIFGYYVLTHDSHRIIYEDYEGFYCEDEVIKESVGQYTGLLDKKYREIYEGDIVTFGSWDEDIEEEWCHTPALVEYKQNEAAFYLTRSCNIPLAHQKDIEVIGNIYENPELLEEK